MGMLDMVEALKWVQEHIHKFGGDKDRVTIFGQSAGSAAIGHLVLSPLTDVSSSTFHQCRAVFKSNKIVIISYFRVCLSKELASLVLHCHLGPLMKSLSTMPGKLQPLQVLFFWA